MKELTGSSSAAGLVFLCIVAPQLLSPLGGLLVDRVRRRTLLLVVNPLTALAVLPLLLVRDAGDVWIVYVVATLYGASYVVLAAGQSALLVTLLPAELLALGQRRAADRPGRGCGSSLRSRAPGSTPSRAAARWRSSTATTFLLATGALLALRLREPKPAREEHHWLRATAGGAPSTSPARPTSSDSCSAARCACS